ncbi:MAG: hypothetical protein QXI91_04235 [Candidatus Bathyarchaeia archaeon]
MIPHKVIWASYLRGLGIKYNLAEKAVPSQVGIWVKLKGWYVWLLSGMADTPLQIKRLVFKCRF